MTKQMQRKVCCQLIMSYVLSSLRILHCKKYSFVYIVSRHAAFAYQLAYLLRDHISSRDDVAGH